MLHLTKENLEKIEYLKELKKFWGKLKKHVVSLPKNLGEQEFSNLFEE